MMNTLLRRGRVLLLALALAVILPGVAMAQSSGTGASEDEQPTIKPRPDEEFVADQVIVKFKPSASPAEEASIRRQEGLEKKKDLGLIDAEVDKVGGQSVEQAVRALNSRPNVEYAQPDFVHHASGYADEPRFSELWGLHNTGQTIQGSVGVADVDVNGLEASAVTQGDPNLVVAVIDSGVDFSHPDLAGRAWTNPGEVPNNNLDDDGNGFVDDVNGADFVNNDGNPFDDNSHGTHVSGTIAASVNGQGVVGVAPNIKIMALKAFNAGGSGATSDAIEAITYAKNKGAKISNNSWGGAPFEQALKDAIDASGSLFVASAGNGGADQIGDDNDVSPSYPASYDSPNILAVAAINNQGNLGSFSNFGATSVDISAPGVNILSSIPGVPNTPAAALSSVGSSGKAVTAGYGADEIGDTADRGSFFTKSFTAVNRGSQPVVLVDDDGSSNGGEADVGPTLAAAIQAATGSAPTVIDVAAGTNGPALSALTGKSVVWATGQEFDSDGAGTTLTATDQTTLTNFLGGGGKLVLTGRDALFNIEAASFVTGTLNLNALSDVPNRTTFAGSAGTAFAGEAYDLNSPTATQPDWHDSLTPRNSSAVTQGLYPGTPGSYAYFNGTSMAAPHVTGVAALAASVEPALLSDPVALKNHVMNTGKPVAATSGKTVTGDMVDAEAAVGGGGETTPPRVTSTVPKATATGVARGVNITATFSEDMDAGTVNGTTFKLFKAGTTNLIPAVVTYDPTAKKATLNPFGNSTTLLSKGTKYKAAVTTGAKDLAGNQLDQDQDPSNGLQQKGWSFTIKN